MKSEYQLIISVIVFGIMTLGIVILLSYNPLFTLILLIGMFTSYWFGRFWEKRVIMKDKLSKEKMK